MIPFRNTRSYGRLPYYKITNDTPVNDAALNAIAYMPTEYLREFVAPEFFAMLKDKDFMRLGTLLARKSYREGGCPIGGVIIDNRTRQILGKGHNSLGQDNDSTTHGETAALRDAGRVAKLYGHGPVDFRATAMFTTLTPCVVCCPQICHRCNFDRVVIADITNAASTESALREGGIQKVEILEDPAAVSLYKECGEEAGPAFHRLGWA